jgi:drug/metabolite transporter (DMT)-like permease
MDTRPISSPYRGGAYGLAAAALFGISPPLAKLLLPDGGPLLIAGLLYLGAGLGLLAFELLFYRGVRTARREAPVCSSDLRLLTGIIIMGGIMGPVLMLWGLQHLSGVVTSLLLNLEAPFTILLAVAFFREHLDKSETMGAMLIIAAAAALNYRPGDVRVDVLGFAAVVGACLCWAIDNNLSQRVSLRDPVVVTRIKTLGAGVCTVSLALLTGQSMPRPSTLIAALLLGLLSYGVSLVLDMQALRLLGAAREAGFFATAPFIGAIAAVPILGERWGISEILATAIMVVGLGLLLRAHHSHLHLHEEVEHDHAHMHADHHEHEHDGERVIEEPHAHRHRHLPLVHDHPHVSELHHRHEHT